MYQGQGYRVDGLLVLDHHVEPKLVIHDCAHAHDAQVNVVSDVTKFPVLVPFRGFSELVPRQIRRFSNYFIYICK